MVDLFFPLEFPIIGPGMGGRADQLIAVLPSPLDEIHQMKPVSPASRTVLPYWPAPRRDDTAPHRHPAGTAHLHRPHPACAGWCRHCRGPAVRPAPRPNGNFSGEMSSRFQMPLMNDSQDALRVVLFGDVGEQVASQGDAAHAKLGLILHQAAGKVAGQQVREHKPVSPGPSLLRSLRRRDGCLRPGTDLSPARPFFWRRERICLTRGLEWLEMSSGMA